MAVTHDLEQILLLLELGALELTYQEGDEFTLDELLREARAYGGGEVELDEQDVRIVLPFVKFLKKSGGRFQLR